MMESNQGSIYSQAMDIINSRRNDALTTYESRIEEIEKKLPEMEKVNSYLRTAPMDLLRAIQRGINVEREIEKIRIQNIQAQECSARVLVEGGYPEDYLELKYTCPLCSDTGFVNGRRCECFEKLIKELSIERLNSNSMLKLCSFSKFNLCYYEGEDYVHMKNTFDYCVNYAENFSKNSKNVLMLGNTGLGKTHLSLSIAEKVIEKGYSVVYDSAANIIMPIENEHFSNSNGKHNEALYAVLSADLVIIDDLGAEFNTNFYTSTIYEIINTRLNKKAPTIINTNLTPDEISSRYHPRITSRIFGEYDYMKFEGNDIRQKIRKNKIIE